MFGIKLAKFILADKFSAQSEHTDKKAFTLAEVLITLGIIGVVAAMTLPALVNQTRGKELETGLQKAYSVIQTALDKMNYDEGQIVNSLNYHDTTSFMNKFKKYFKLAKDCNKSDCELADTDDENLSVKVSSHYKTYNNKPMMTSYLDDGQVMISDGMFFFAENNAGDGRNLLFISVDVNGYEKKPNRWGHDLFTFQIMEDGKLLPMGAEGTMFQEDKGYCSATATNTYNGIACTYKALTEKDYFRNLPK